MKTQRMTVNLRRTDTLMVKPEAEAIDGKTYEFTEGWEITEEDSSIYAGEVAMIPHDKSYPIDAPCWIASGDLTPAKETS